MGIALAVTAETDDVVQAFMDCPDEFVAVLANLAVSWNDDAQMADWMAKFRAHAAFYGSTERRCLYGLLSCLGVELLAIPTAQEAGR